METQELQWEHIRVVVQYAMTLGPLLCGIYRQDVYQTIEARHSLTQRLVIHKLNNNMICHGCSGFEISAFTSVCMLIT